MHTRLVKIIELKSGGKRVDFASFLGWSPQYLHKLIKGHTFGITPVITILTKFPEINARWLLFGDGEMIDNSDKICKQKRAKK